MSETILVVDDEPVIGVAIALILYLLPLGFLPEGVLMDFVLPLFLVGMYFLYLDVRAMRKSLAETWPRSSAQAKAARNDAGKPSATEDQR